MKVGITGSNGFLGRHLRVALRAGREHEVIPIDRELMSNPHRLADAVAGADAVVHLAGINRAEPGLIEEGNADLAQRLVDALESDRRDEAPSVLYANSVHAGRDDPYGRGKRRAADILEAWADKVGARFVDVRLTNVFGEWGRPYYNSVVATFCHQLTHDETPTIIEDRMIELVHAQEAAARMIAELQSDSPSRQVEIGGRPIAVSELLEMLGAIRDTYHSGRLPDLPNAFAVDLFNTYRAYLYPTWYPSPLRSNTDARGNFVELAQSSTGETQTSFSTTAPGITRGEHYHLRKIERFVVLSGQATIAIRPVLSGQVTRYEVSGDMPAFVDMPTLCAHNITNTGSGTLYTAFWANEIFDPDRPDTFREAVG